MKYLHKFTSKAAFDAAYSGNDYIEPWVSIRPGPPASYTIIKDENLDEYKMDFYDVFTENVYDYNGNVVLSGTMYRWTFYGEIAYFVVSQNRELSVGDGLIIISDEYNNRWQCSYDWESPNYTIDTVTILVASDKNVIDYNKHQDYDFELVWDTNDTCGLQELTNFSSRVGFDHEDSETDHLYYITGASFTTNPVQSFKVKVSNCEGYNGIYTVTYSGGDGENYWDTSSEDEQMFFNVSVWSEDDVWKLTADFTDGC